MKTGNVARRQKAPNPGHQNQESREGERERGGVNKEEKRGRKEERRVRKKRKRKETQQMKIPIPLQAGYQTLWIKRYGQIRVSKIQYQDNERTSFI